MPLPKPTLDNRRYDQLVGEGEALIPRLAPQWTNQNASDPGITLIELAAWLAEQNIYRFDRVSTEASRAFVRLVGIEPRSAGVATTVVTVANTGAADVALPAGLQLAAETEPLFETTTALHASAATLVSVQTAGPATSTTASPLDVTAANATLSGYAAFGVRPRRGHALRLGFDRPLDAPGATLSLHVWTESWLADRATRAALEAEQAMLATTAPAHCSPPDWKTHYRVTTVWEFYAGSGLWQPLADVVDETRALSLSGFVRFGAPAGHKAEPGQPYWLRCRIVHGRFECPPRLLHVGFNAVDCAHAVSVEEEQIGLGRGHALAVFATTQRPVVAGSVRLRVDDGAGDAQLDWAEAADFDRAGPFDRVAMLDAERGELRFGDGLRGATAPAGHAIHAAYRVSGGLAGNVDAGTLAIAVVNAHNVALVPAWAAIAPTLALAQPFAALGGSERETLAAAQGRAYDAVSSVDKAVTLADIERLALATPGVPVARVRAVANLWPQLPCYPAPSVVSLIVIPPCPRRAPLPSQALLTAVARYLEPRRLVTSEIHAIAPSYRRVAVRATLHLHCDADAKVVRAAALARLDAFLDPLGGGPDATGWPFGRSVYRTEVMAMLADVAGVDRVTALQLISGASDASNTTAGACGCAPAAAATDSGRCDNVDLCAHELVLAGRHLLTIEADIAPELRRSKAHECDTV